MELLFFQGKLESVVMLLPQTASINLLTILFLGALSSMAEVASSIT
jgi:hypothetical protein